MTNVSAGQEYLSSIRDFFPKMVKERRARRFARTRTQKNSLCMLNRLMVGITNFSGFQGRLFYVVEDRNSERVDGNGCIPIMFYGNVVLRFRKTSPVPRKLRLFTFGKILLFFLLMSSGRAGIIGLITLNIQTRIDTTSAKTWDARFLCLIGS